jgi:hypothetical protein
LLLVEDPVRRSEAEPQLRAQVEAPVHRRGEVEVERRLRADRGRVVAVVYDGGRGRAVAVAVRAGRCWTRQRHALPRRRRLSPPAGPAGRLDGGAGATRRGGGDRRWRDDEATATGAAGGQREVGAGEVGPGERAAQVARGDVVGARRGLGGVVGAEPDARALVRVADLRREPPPRPLPHAPVPRGCRRVAHRVLCFFTCLLEKRKKKLLCFELEWTKRAWWRPKVRGGYEWRGRRRCGGGGGSVGG